MNTKRVNFHMDNDLFVEVKIKMLKEGTNMTNILIGFLKAYADANSTANGGTGYRADFTEDEYVNHMRKLEVSTGDIWTLADEEDARKFYQENQQ